jgi:hypothetical protein
MKIIRLTYNTEDKILYTNYFDSYYRPDEVGKDMNKKRSDLARNIDKYCV